MKRLATNSQKLMKSHSFIVVNRKRITNEYIVKKLFDFLQSKLVAEIIRYNKRFQKTLGFKLNDYKCSSKVEIEIIERSVEPSNLNINKGDEILVNRSHHDPPYCSCFINNFDLERKGNDLPIGKNANIMSITVYGIEPLTELLCEYRFVRKIDFIGFNGNDITDVGRMLFECMLFKGLNSPVLNVSNNINMSSIFYGCELSKELNPSKFKSHKVTTVNAKFYGCISLEETDVADFRTDKVAALSCAFGGCESLKEINLMKFNANKVTSIYSIRGVIERDFLSLHCRSLKELNTFNNFKIAVS